MKYKLLSIVAIFVFFACVGNNNNKGTADNKTAIKDTNNYFIINGFAEGTMYSVTYYDEERRNLQPEIEALIQKFEQSLSVYDSTSIISRVNRNEDVELDEFFIKLFNRSKEISQQTNGAFDISGEPLFLAWGFSFKNKIPMSAHKVDSLKQYVGMNKIRIENSRIIKTNPNIVLNGNAVAKGYSSDVVADFLDKKSIEDYLINIGGEMRMKGVNRRGKEWHIAIDSPIDGNYMPGEDVQLILKVSGKGLATSGNYRRFYIDENGNKIGHTINPITGYPVNHSLLSSTVIADDCLTADAFATAFLVVGLDSAKRWVEKFPELEALFIYDDGGEFKTFCTEKMEKRIVEFIKKQKLANNTGK